MAVGPAVGKHYIETVVPPGQPLPEEEAELKTLQEANRKLAEMQSTEGVFKGLYATPGYHPEVGDLSCGWETADGMKGLIPYAFPLDLLKAAVLYKEPGVQPATAHPDAQPTDTAKRIAEECYTLMHSIRNPATTVSQSFESVLWEYLECCHHGQSLVEKFWKTETSGPLKGKWTLRRLVYRHPEDYGFDLDRNTLEVRHITRKYAPSAEQSFLQGDRASAPPLLRTEDLIDRRIPIEKFVRAAFKPFKGLPYGLGHFRPCYNPTTFLSAMYRLWGRAQEKTGIPFASIVSGSTRADIMDEQRKLADQMMQAMSVVWPAGTIPTWVNAVQGVSEGFERAVMHQCMQIVLLILFQTLTTSADGKSAYSLGQVHQATQEFALAQVRKATEWDWTHQLFADYVRYNWGEQYLHETPRLYLGLWGLNELNLLADMLQKYFTMGILGPEEDNDWVRQVAKLRPGKAPQPDPLDRTLVGGGSRAAAAAN